ncbi:hypothetical protein J1N35_023618 [Gossypium stocksii]|uniref:(+)-delta-cadinene synthase n=1 Tax=Gossypium stocksii TaxID=47602 RepID=A0A9D4A3V5_9ROSI|nr:hypothetical protein J1N35_023618 [Gossypium stocksii]
MSSQICSSKLPSSTHRSMSNHNRPSANFHLCVWGDTFLSSPSKMKEDATIQQQHGELKEEIRRMVKVAMDDDLLHKLRLIDTIRRLGVSYHFEREIEEALHNIYEHDCNDDQTLEATSLRFRLLRENGFSFHCDTFYKFKDDEGNFDKSLTSDVKGLLELYEAAHLRVHGEDILEEALGFTTTHLDLAKAAGTIEFPLSVLVSRARDRPIRKCLPRLEARRFIDIYKDDGSHDKTLLKFVELDFNLLQNLHKEELNKISKWDADCIDQLPEYMKFFYKSLLDVYGEVEKAMAEEEKLYCVEYSKNMFKQLSEAYMVEANWCHENYVPTMEEYMRNAILSAGYIMVTLTSFIGMGDLVTPKIFHWASTNPKIIAASSIVARLMDDIASHKVVFPLESR